MSTHVSKRTAMPLALVALTFFLPMANSCDHVVSPLSYIREAGSFGALWVAPTFATAAILAAAVLRSAHGVAKTASAFWATAALVATLPIFAIMFAFDSAAWLSVVYGATAIASMLLLRRARSVKHDRLAALLDTYAVAALPLAAAIAELGHHYGASIFLVSYAAFVTQRAVLALRRAMTTRNERAQTNAHVRVAEEIALTDVTPQVRVEQDLAQFDEALHDHVTKRRAV